MEDLATKDLDSTGTISRISLLLSFRQDALAAADSQSRNRPQFADAIGRFAQDWPLTILLCEWGSDREGQDTAIQQNEGFLSAAYPIVFSAAFNKAGRTYDVPPELLYGVVRRETFLYPSALSAAGGLGLFQFTPDTFAALDKRWDLLKNSGLDSYQEFLLNPDRSIDLGARWFRDELLRRNNGDLVAAVLEHIAGRSAVNEWNLRLQSLGRSGDVEYAIESVSSMDARRFMRGVLTDMAIVWSAGIAQSPSDPSFQTSQLAQKKSLQSFLRY